jgi:Family of unknown function (DUF6348)
MFSWFRHKTPKGERAAAAPNLGADVKVAIDDLRPRSERLNLIDIAWQVLVRQSHKVTAHDTWLQLPDWGLVIRPTLEQIKPLENGAVHTITTIESRHPAFNADHIFEYQHSTGNSVADSLTNGFDDWVRMDLVTLLEALRPAPEQCMMMEMEFPAHDGAPGRRRRAILGPVAHYCQHARSPRERRTDRKDDHDFCPCCLFTRSFDAFKKLLEDDHFYGIRLFAMRNENGVAGADCRVNGKEWEPGKEALRRYVGTWSDAGVEFRKQYVVLRSIESTSPAAKVAS